VDSCLPCFADRFLTYWARRRWRGFLTLRRLLRRPVVKLKTQAGVLFELRPDDYIDGIVLHDGFYEPEVLAALQSSLAPGAVLWDIGANFGLHAVSAAATLSGLQVHAFEPNPAMLIRIEAHARFNSATLRAWPYALSDRDGTALLHVNASGNPGMTTLTPWSEGTYSHQIEVPLARADTLITSGQIPAPHAIKLDVEGAESAVLAGFGRCLHDVTLRAVVFETRADLLEDPDRCPAARQLRAAGFSFRALPRAASSTHALNNFLAYRAS
jgi:FkbM family methyltransferase